MKRKRTNEILFNFKSPIQSYFQKKNNQKTRNSNLLYPSITHYHCKFQTLQLPRQISLSTIHYQVFDYATTSPLLRNRRTEKDQHIQGVPLSAIQPR